jgi:dTDP-glucose 4,6-dehydratase
MKVVYITGCLGFIGAYVTRMALEKGWQVRGIDKITYAGDKDLLSQFLIYNNFIFEHKDINEIEFLYDCDYFINIAAETHVGNSIVNSDDFMSSNVNGVHHILELLRNYRQENTHQPILIQISTDEVYGDIDQGAHTEEDLLKPSNPYSATKAAADMFVMSYGRTYNLPYIILRPTNNYGIGQYVEKLSPKAIKFLNMGRQIPLHNNGLPVRNWLHAADTAQAVMTVIEKGEVNEIYNVCGGYEQTNLEVVTKILMNYNRITKIVTEKGSGALAPYLDLSYSRDGQDVRYALDDSKLRKLGWKPKKVFDEELPSIVEYYKEKFIW